jgi:replicative superfamily II helicase
MTSWAHHLLCQVHILNETRGSTLEVVISRMRTRGSAVRFVLVSATVPNIEDIASWIGSASQLDEPAKVHEVSQVQCIVTTLHDVFSSVRNSDLAN